MMKVSELIRALKADGWYLDHNGANHDQYRHPTKPGQIPIPRHAAKELKTKTAYSILKQAGLK